MKSLRDALYGAFLLYTIAMIAFFTQGDLLFSDIQSQQLQVILMPGYLVLSGIIVGSLLHVLITPLFGGIDKTATQHEQYISSGLFLGLMIGVILAFLYIARLG